MEMTRLVVFCPASGSCRILVSSLWYRVVVAYEHDYIHHTKTTYERGTFHNKTEKDRPMRILWYRVNARGLLGYLGEFVPSRAPARVAPNKHCQKTFHAAHHIIIIFRKRKNKNENHNEP
jgi:hypothetical protein